MSRANIGAPAVLDHFKKLGTPKFQYGLKHVIKPEVSQEIIKKLDLGPKYKNSNKLEIIDIFSGYGLFSSLLNHNLKPSRHLIIEDSKENVTIWEDRIEFLKDKTGNKENFVLFPRNGFKWETYDDLRDSKLVEPSFKDRDNVHNELLIVGNLTSQKFGESLLAQWIMCSVYKNWLQKYGRVRMVCFIPEATAQKFLSGPYFNKRNKSAIKRELFTDLRLIAISESSNNSVPNGSNYDPNLIMRDQPYLIPSKAVLPSNTNIAVVELVPKKVPEMDIPMLEYILQILMYRSTGKLLDALAQLAPGAESDLGPQIPDDMKSKSPRDLDIEEFLYIFDVFNNWAFKPSYTDTIGIFQDDSRNF